jgi:PIN domain nuclease of toxin-antitoxin system
MADDFDAPCRTSFGWESIKLLVDTHTFIWWNREPDLVPPETLKIMRQSQLLLSLV